MPWPQILAAILIVIAGGVLRFAYYARGDQVDEQITREIVKRLRQSGDWDVNWAKADLPPDLRYDQYNFSSHVYATYFFYRLTKFVPGTETWRGEREGFLVYKFFAALLACIALLQTLWLGLRAGGWMVALGAELLTGVVPLLVQDAHYARPEPFVTVLTLAVVLLCWPRPQFRPWRPMAAAFGVGLLVACKVSMLALAWVPFVPLAAAWHAGVNRRWLVAAGVAFTLVAGFAIGAPGAWMHPAAFWHGVQALTHQYAGIHPPHSHSAVRPVADMMGRYFVATLGWAALAGFAGGVAMLVRERRWLHATLLVVPVLLFAGYFATRTVFFERNVSHIVPLFCIVSALGAARLADWLAGRWPVSRAGLAAGCFLLLAWRPATISRALVFDELPGHGTAAHDIFEADVRARHRDAAWHGELDFNGDRALNELASRLQANPQALIVRVTDYRDDISADHIATLHQRFTARVAAENPGTFPSVPTCTLLTYHRPTYWYFLVTGVRQ